MIIMSYNLLYLHDFENKYQYYRSIMEFLTNDKLVIVGAGGAIGSNMAQTALMLGLTPNICLYDI